MQDSGARRRFILRDKREFSLLRMKAGMQKQLVSPRLSPATISRLERGFPVTEESAHAMHQRVAPDRPFTELFDLAFRQRDVTKFSWEQVNRSAAQIGRKVFREFRPNLVITFAGPSHLFTSLAMTRTLTREEFLKTEIYTGSFHTKISPVGGHDPQYYSIRTHRFLLRMPKALRRIPGRATKRVAIIDDTVTTGSVLEHLKNDLADHGYKKKNIIYTTCVVSQTAFDNELTRPDRYTYKVRGSYRMPWGDPL